MSAYKDFIEAQASILAVLETLGSKSVTRARSPEQLVLNGLRISAFVALEDFLRRRTLEVFHWLGTSGVTFKNLPQRLQSLVLQGTVSGLHFSLAKTDKSEQITLLQLQGLLLGGTGENQPFVPSEYFFGKASSNISSDDVHQLLGAMGLPSEKKLECLDLILELIGMKHLGTSSAIFSTLSRSRHRSAHAFPGEFELDKYKTIVSTSLPVLAFSVDTCLSQTALRVVKAVKAAENYSSYDLTKVNIRVFEFDQQAKAWNEYRAGRQLKPLVKGGLEKRLEDLSAGVFGKEDSALVKEPNGSVTRWHQPVPQLAV
jgi:hypothetical protein